MRIVTVLFLFIATHINSYAAITAETYKQADNLRELYNNKVTQPQLQAHWINGSSSFWYIQDLIDQKTFILVHPDAKTKKPAFDHSRLASALNEIRSSTCSETQLPFDKINFATDFTTIQFEIDDSKYQCDLSTYEITSITKEENQESKNKNNEDESVPSPNKTWKAYIENHNLYIQSTLTKEKYTLTVDGTEEQWYENIQWSPDSQKIVCFLHKKGQRRQVHYVESSPDEQLLPKHEAVLYDKPGDVLDIQKPCLFSLTTKTQIPISDELFPNPFSIHFLSDNSYGGGGQNQWHRDSSEFYYFYNQRGHQLNRIIAVDADTGKTRTVLEETSETFIDYASKNFIRYMDETNEIIWMSERDGWNHLYLYDIQSGAVKNQITRGEWVVRKVIHVDEENRQLWFEASGMHDEEDPYYIHVYKINFDGSHLIELTPAKATHTAEFSPDYSYFVDIYTTPTQPPIYQLRDANNGTLTIELEKSDASKLYETGWKAPEPFMSMSRDGKHEIWGLIYRPRNYDEMKSYPVLEYIYSGPHDSHVPKYWVEYRGVMKYCELGFIVVRVDGMGTSNRSREFHHFCWQNLNDAGLPDHIKWLQAAAKKYPYMDLDRVGIYGTSAGGQNTMSALLNHPKFYKVGVASCGCYDNRMDKVWWNEQWMGYPTGTHYEENANATHVKNLQGKLLLILGEMDKNVDPASTMQLVDALIKADKDFDFLFVPGMGHSSGGAYGDRKRMDFFVEHLLGETPPNWNEMMNIKN